MGDLPKIDDEERQARRQAVEYAQASVALEGFEISEPSKKLAQRFIDGEIDLDEYLNTSIDDAHGV